MIGAHFEKEDYVLPWTQNILEIRQLIGKIGSYTPQATLRTK